MSKIEIVFILLFAVVSIVSTVAKSRQKAEAQQNTPKKKPSTRTPQFAKQHGAQKTVSKKESYFTYETCDPNYDPYAENLDNLSYDQAVESDNQEEISSGVIDFTPAELYRGIIFSEILQRPKYL